MFVGEVRAATVVVGSSWKLSGGSQFSSAVTKVSKKCQVLRAMRWSKVSCSRLSSGAGCSMGRLIHHAIQGATSQRTKNGRATIHRAGCTRPKEIAPPSAIAGANHIAPYEPARSVRALRATSPEVTHSSKCRRVMNTRQSVRPIAVRLRKASFGRNAKVSPIWPSVRFDDASIPRKCIRHGNCSGLRRSSTTSESKPGSAMMARRMHVAHQTAAGVDRFQQVVAQNSILRKAAGQCALESIDVINAFADERAPAEKILINIRDGAGVGIDSDFARVQPNES